MELTFINPGFESMLESILAFQTGDETAFWTEPLYHFYPQLNRELAASLPFSQRAAYLRMVLEQIYREQEGLINEKVHLYSGYWDRCRAQITEALSEAFGLDCAGLFNDMTCHVSMNPICPRFLQEHAFDIFYLNSDKGAIGLAIHEIIHFVWFHVWHHLFHDGWEEYERPSMKWILSEMVVESIGADPRLRSINPYFPREEGGCIYPYFFDMEAEGKPVLETLDAMYRSLDIHSFMRAAYAYCLQHESEIRNHIRASEESWSGS